MANTLNDTGKYKAPNGEIITFEYSFKAYASIQDAVATEGEGEILALINRMSKVDARNNTSVKVQSANGHSKTVKMTPEQKVMAKAKRAENSEKLKALDGLSVEQILELLGK